MNSDCGFQNPAKFSFYDIKELKYCAVIWGVMKMVCHVLLNGFSRNLSRLYLQRNKPGPQKHVDYRR